MSGPKKFQKKKGRKIKKHIKLLDDKTQEIDLEYPNLTIIKLKYINYSHGLLKKSIFEWNI